MKNLCCILSSRGFITPPHRTLIVILLNLIAFKPEALLAQCLPPAPVIANGSFESGDYPCTAPLDAFAYGCVDDWFAGSQSPTIFEEFSVASSSTVTPQQGDYFALCAAFNDPVAEVCRHEAIVQEIDLIPGLSYRLQFYASTVSPSPYDDPLELNVYFTSGLTNAPTTSDVGLCLSLSPGDLVYSASFESYGAWTLVDITFQVPANSTADQLVVFPISYDEAANTYFLLLDNFSIGLCTYSDLEAAFQASLQSGLTYDFEDVTAEAGGVTVEEWCWDFGDGDYSSLQNPTHTYDEAGTYEVCLTIIDSKGCMNEHCMTIVAEQACDCDDRDFLYINGEQTWDATTVLGNHLVIPAGSRLIVDGATLLIGKGCKIFVERGARLDIINESTLTSGCDTGRWGGIEVWGNGALAHPASTSGITGGTYPGSNSEHGVVYLNNGSTLSEAVVAISTESQRPYWQPYGGGANWGLHWGGIIYAEGNDADGPVTFLANGKGVGIQKFPHPSIANPANPYPNRSYFYKCFFDENTVGLSIWDSDDIGINTSTFRASEQVCITGIDFSATIQKCTLSNSPVGIEANYTPGAMMPYNLLIGDPDVSANGNSLDELSYGVVTRSAPRLVIGNNDFSTGLVGAYLLGASGYNIKANNFTDYWYGVVVNQTSAISPGDLICNTYSAIQYDGILAWGNNNRLEFKQETFDIEDSRDVRLLQQTDGTFGSINGAQGQIDNPVFNLFSGDDHITADLFSTQQFFYYPPGPNITSTYPDLVPRCDLLLTNCSSGNPNHFYNDPQQLSLSDYDDGCLDLSGVGDLASEAPCMSLGCLDTLNTEIANRRALIDDGDTEGLLYAIATDPNATQTFNDLRTASPYLSNEVLEALLESGMTTGKKDSLATINAPLAFTLMALAEAELSAPAYAQIEYLRETQGVSTMEILQSELSDLERRRSGAIDAMVKDHIDKLEFGAADTLLMNEGEVKKRIGLKLYTLDLTTAQTLLNTLPAGDYKTLQQINIDRLDEGHDYELENSDAEDLEEIAAKVSPEAAYAQALLTLLRGDTFALQLPEEEESLIRPQLIGAQPLLPTELKVQPNPTQGQVEVILPAGIIASEQQEGRLELYDLKGQLIRTTALTGPSTTWQIGELPDGVYLLRYTNGGAILAAKVIIQH